MAKHTQAYLRKNRNPEMLKNKYKIKYREHPTLPLVKFNYDQIKSPKMKKVVRECRGLVLEKGTWNLVCKPFERFFNLGENKEDMGKFHWDSYVAYEKVDGSLMMLFNYNGQWLTNTRGAFADQSMHPGIDRTWEEWFWYVAPFKKEDLIGYEDHTFIFELCTPYNKVVVSYDKPRLFLLSAFRYDIELTHEELTALELCEMPPVHRFHTEKDMDRFMQRMEGDDRLTEGIVLRDKNNIRFKVKTLRYLSLHRLKNNGNIIMPKNLIPIILYNEQDEVLTYFPEMGDIIDECQKIIFDAKIEVIDLWSQYRNVEAQKEFALGVKDHPLSSILFNMRKYYPEDEEDRIDKMIRENSDTIVKALFRDKVFEMGLPTGEE